MSSEPQFDFQERVRNQPGVSAGWAGLCLTVGLVLSMLCGCESSSRGTMDNAYYLTSYESLRELGRVTLVELDNVSVYHEISVDVTKALFMELQKKQVFSVTTVGREDPGWRALQQNLDSLQAMQTLLTIRENLRCNGLLLGTITEYRPYPRLTIALRMKLLDLTDGQVLWGVEQVWDSTDKNVRKRLEDYFHNELHSWLDFDPSPLPEQLLAVSSLEFAKFVAYEVARTLEGRKR
ncbi:MAG: hypothetical protein JW955_01335 [Sedimentisphaerales bacterium]|nr:hypothetical protein [Sedimentisphaerales bacterium]